MYLSLPFSHVVALDAKSGKELWRYQHRRRTEKMCCGPANRGVAVAYGQGFIGTGDARLIALDPSSRQPVLGIALAEDFGRATAKTDPPAADDSLRHHRARG